MNEIKDLVFIGRIWNDSCNAPSIKIASYRKAIECCASCVWKAIEDGKEPVGIFLSSVSDHDTCPLCKTEYSDLSQKKATEWIEKNILSYSEKDIESMDKTKKKDNIINYKYILQAKNIAKELSEWLSTEEGKKCMNESQKQGQDIIKSMKDARNISAESLREQITI